jgi:hypothetical protein
LSTRMLVGLVSRDLTTASTVWTTSSPVSHCPERIAKLSQLKLSTNTNTRYRSPEKR